MIRTTSATIVLTLTTLASPLTAQPPAVLTNGGVVYEVMSGTYSELFTDEAVPAATRVLALGATVNGAHSRLLVPSTDNEAYDHRPVLLYDRGRDALNLIWERRGATETQVQLIRFDGTEWSEVSTLLTYATNTAFGTARTLTRDAHSWEVAGGGSALSDRSILHLVRSDGSSGAHYSPLIFIDGSFAGWGESFALLGLFDVDPTIPTGAPNAALLDAISLAVGADGQHIQVAVVDPRSGHVVVLQVGVQPLDLAFFAAEVRIGLEALVDLYQTGSAASIRGPMRSVILVGGQNLGLDDSIITYVADTVDAWADTWTALNPDADFDAFSTALLDLVNDLTLALFAGAGGGQVIELDLDDDVAVPTQLFQVQVASAHPAPATGPGLHRIFASTEGSRVIIAWHEATTGTVYYVESTGDAAAPWSTTTSIRLSATMTPKRVEELLRQRVQ